MGRRRLLLGLFVPLSLLAAFLAWPSPVDAVAWSPPPARGGDVFARNELLRGARVWRLPRGEGPESVVVAADGQVISALRDGTILAFDRSGETRELLRTDGHPLGLALAPDGSLWIADADRGLLRADLERESVEVVATEADGVPFRFTDAVTVATDGTVYFTDATFRHGAHEFILDVMSGRGSGRLLRLAPGAQTPTVLLRGLYFANGVALSADGSFLLVNETARYRVTRYWLTGPRRGQHEVFVDRLPGFPDNVTRSPRGTFWLAMYTVRKPLLDRVHPFPFAKELLAKIPSALRPGPSQYGYVLELDEDGRVLRTLQDPGGEVLFSTTSALEHDGALYVGSLRAAHVGVVGLASGADDG